MFSGVYAGKRVLVTGHTGFKGTWLCSWLLKLNAQVAGFSNGIPTQPSMFQEIGLEGKITHYVGDVRDLDVLKKALLDFKPDFVFHLAAQAIVSVSYNDPVETITTNVIGTMNVLEALRQINAPCNVVMITSDKCYENVEWEWGYRETDQVGGKDIYSGSKGAAEVVIHSYVSSFFPKGKSKVRIATGRAGNVIGGGDWAKDRIVVDCMKNWADGQTVEIRSPSATRPWQHVLEPLSGYLTLGWKLSQNLNLHGEAFNFGPRSEQNRTVVDLLTDLSKYWDFGAGQAPYKVVDAVPFHEAGLLKLNCDKALFHLRWEANLLYAECVRFVSEWYFDYYKTKTSDMYAKTLSQIEQYEHFATAKEFTWIK